MPYIQKQRRDELEAGFVASPDTPGELNYMLTKLCVTYCAEHGISYQRINDVLGALEGAKLEFYRRLAAPYEDKKIAENGDVY